VLSAAQRFVVLAEFNNEAVLDKQTGLVWEQAPDTNSQPWPSAAQYCVNKNVGGTVGWRLPSVVELKSVQDPSLPAPFIPASVFTGIQAGFYWSSSTRAELASDAWFVWFGNGPSDSSNKSFSKGVWCVRGPMQEAVY
jgi:hypothetical protein